MKDFLPIGTYIRDMGERPEGMTLERKDNFLGYFKGNCVWATMKVQNRNRRDTRKYTFNGETLCLTDWAHKIGMDPGSLWARINRWGLEQPEAVMMVEQGKKWNGKEWEEMK